MEGSDENKFPAFFIAFKIGKTNFFSKKRETRRANVSTSYGQVFTLHHSLRCTLGLDCGFDYNEWKALMLLCEFTLESHGNFTALSPFLYCFPTV